MVSVRLNKSFGCSLFLRPFWKRAVSRSPRRRAAELSLDSGGVVQVLSRAKFAVGRRPALQGFVLTPAIAGGFPRCGGIVLVLNEMVLALESAYRSSTSTDAG